MNATRRIRKRMSNWDIRRFAQAPAAIGVCLRALSGAEEGLYLRA